MRGKVMGKDSKVVLITGASSGIGAVAAERLAAAGHTVVLGARRADRLAEVAEKINANGGTATALPLDVTDRAGFARFADTARDRHGRIDVLVNNAGVMPLSRLDALRVDEWQQTIDVNLTGTLHGIAAVLPWMTEHGGHIVNISSTLAFEVVPASAVYSATKAAVRALSDGLRKEHQNIRVSVISPSFTESELLGSGGDPGTMAWVQDMASKLNMPTSVVADAIAYAVDQPATIDVSEIVVRPAAQAG
ncbi:SDR family oxidoreductase [Lentzea sp. NPDC058450]|uniref:SDR family oxidoreductase n=1 Tax=Lentzea sp. NPDC058450 TaxID=3346505 RepID=UPI00365CC6AE